MKHLLREFEKNGDPARAKAMAKYMKSDQHFYGLQKPLRSKILKGKS